MYPDPGPGIVPIEELDRVRELEQELRRSQDSLRLAARATQDLLWDWDLERGQVTWEGNTRPFFGCPPEGMPQPAGDRHRAWADRVHPEDLAIAEATARAAVDGGAESWEHEYRFRRADDSWAHMLERAFIVRHPQGRGVRVVGAMRDVSGRKETENAQTRLAAIVSSSNDAVIGKTLDGIVTSWNAAAERIFGYSATEMVGRSIFDLIPEEFRAEERDLMARIRQGQRVEFADTERVRKDGQRIHISVTVSPIFDAAGLMVGASSIKRDITERKRAAEELARRQERYRALVTATTSIVWTADPDGRFVEAQASWEEYTGQPWEDHRGLGWLQAVHPDDRESVQAGWLHARETQSIFEAHGRLWSVAHNAYRHFVSRAAPVRGPHGSFREWIGTVTDMEDRWLAEERLRQAEKMESVGRLAGGIAHEVNNQMTVILGSAEFVLRRPLDEGVREDVEHIRRAAQRTAAITQQLLAFSRRQVLQPQIVDLNAAVTALQSIIGRAIGETCRLVLRLAPDLGRVKADPGQLDQVLLNLVLNARDAMPDGGVLRIETAPVMLDEAYAAGKSVQTITPGPYALLVVSDTGRGIEPATLSHIFEPFFTTKAVGEGTGLGLATVYGIVKQSGGFVWAYSEPGQGTSFKIYLPLAGSVPGWASGATAMPEAGGHEVILVAEDEATVRSVIARSLREYGHAVLEAKDGVEALELAERHPDRIDLAIADVVMPGMSGRELAARLSRRWPNLPVLFTSGYTGLDAVGRGLLDEGRDFIQKPLEPDTLVRKIRQMLDAGAARSGRAGDPTSS